MASSIPLPLAAAIIDRSVSLRGSPKRPAAPPAQPLSDKAHQRLIRQAIIQAECEAEERDALRVTKEELDILRESVKSVKAEFDDLDGLSWDTPEAQQILNQWHAEQAARAEAEDDPARLGGIPIRRSNVPCISFPAAPPGLPSLSLSVAAYDADLDLTPMPSPVGGPGFGGAEEEDTIRLPLCDSRRSLGASTVVPDREDAATPLPALFASASAAASPTALTSQSPDKENDAPAPQPARPALPKSHSAPLLALALAPTPTSTPSPTTASPARTHPAHARLPPSRIPVRSKSLSARATPPWGAPSHKPTRFAPLLGRHNGRRAVLVPQGGGGRAGALAEALSASPRRAHPGASPRRGPGIAAPSRQGEDGGEREEREEDAPQKFRIVSAPAGGARMLRFPPASSSSPSPTSAHSPARASAHPRAHDQHGEVQEEVEVTLREAARRGALVFACPDRLVMGADGRPRVGAEAGRVRVGKRGRGRGSAAQGEGEGEGAPESPRRASRVVSRDGAVPMRRT